MQYHAAELEPRDILLLALILGGVGAIVVGFVWLAVWAIARAIG